MRHERGASPSVGAATAPVSPAPNQSTTALPASGPTGPTSAERLALGITEDNANLLWSPSGAHQPPAAFQDAQRELTALHPAYVRLLVDWAALQPRPDQAPALEGTVDGCAREVGPCGSYAGLREELAAIASQQRSTGGYRVVLDISGVPPWAAQAPSGCEGTGSAGALAPAAIAAYQSLIRSLAALGEQEGVALEWWSPWNEPNNLQDLSPQRARCSIRSPSLVPAVYAQLARAMAAELHSLGGERHLLLGELAGYTTGSPHRTSIAEFVAALPEEVICSSQTWSLHVYVTYDGYPAPVDPLRALEAALDARGPCGQRADIWITETGVGAPDPGRMGPPEAGGEQAGCRALAAQMLRWYGDRRLRAVFQYTFREDPDYPVGLISADLGHLYPVYYLWLAWSEALARGGSPAALPSQCT